MVEHQLPKLLAYLIIGKRTFGNSVRPAAYGRKRTLITADFRHSKRPLWRKADIPEYPQDFHKIDQLGTAALRSEADIRLE